MSTIITSPRLFSAGQNILPIDMNDPTLAFYLPLWYPYSDMTGSTIYSYDKNRLSCTVTGATWGITGRTFDLTDDVITTTAPLVTDTFTFCAWVKFNSIGEGQDIANGSAGHHYIQATATGALQGMTYDTAARVYATAAGIVSAGIWYFIVDLVDIPNDTRQIWVDTTLVKDDTTDVNSIGSSSTTWRLGGNGVANGMGGIMGEAILYNNKRLTSQELQNIRLATKWRYS